MKKMLLPGGFASIVLIMVLILLVPAALMGTPDFVGNILSYNEPENFSLYWNQVTSENAAKWPSIEAVRDQYNWTALDRNYQYTKDRGIPYKFHTLLWGCSEAGWLVNLSRNEQRAEFIEWLQAVSGRYNPELIDVVNEPLHAPSIIRDALGGAGTTGWDWVVEAFTLSRQYFSGKLLINEYGIINDSEAIDRYLEIINLLNERGVIDGIGVQCHSFSLNSTAPDILKANLDKLGATGLPIYISEMDVQGDDAVQLEIFQKIWPVFYNHPSVRGITLWGYIWGQTWRENIHLVSSGAQGAEERPAMEYLKPFLLSHSPEPGPTPSGTTEVWGNIKIRAAGHKGGEMIEVRVNRVVADAWILQQGFQTLTADGTGVIEIYFINDEIDDDYAVQIDYVEYNGQIYEAEDQAINTGVWQDDSCGGSFSEWLHCSGYIRFGHTPDPSPTPSPTPAMDTPGKVSFQLSSYSADPGTALDVEIYVNTGTQDISSYGIIITYPAALLALNTEAGGVSPGTGGFVTTVKDEAGELIFSGFDQSGKGPDEELHLVTLHFTVLGEGTGTIYLTVSGLEDSGDNNIGIPRGDEASFSAGTNCRGDVDGSGLVDIIDALMTAQEYIGLSPDPFNPQAGDVDCNGTLDIVDALMIAQYYVGLLPSLCCG